LSNFLLKKVTTTTTTTAAAAAAAATELLISVPHIHTRYNRFHYYHFDHP